MMKILNRDAAQGCETTKNKPLKVFISAGEASGDMLGAALAEYLFARMPGIVVHGIGGARMRDAGVKTVYDIADLSVIGFLEAVSKLPKLYAIKRKLKQLFCGEKYDVFCGVDYPGFNVNVAGMAKKCGMKTLCYKGPSIWSWGEWRVRSVKKNVDFVAAIFPFEAEAYLKHGVKSEYVGNPIVDRVLSWTGGTDVYGKYHLDRDKTVVLLLPGSRRGEIRKLLPVILETAKLVGRQRPVQYVLPIASTVDMDQVNAAITESGAVGITIADSADMYALMKIAKCGIATSGTVTLEAALNDMPCAIVYRTSKFTYSVLKRLAKIKYAGLPNLIMNEELLPEYLQDGCRPELVAVAVNKILTDDKYMDGIRFKFALMREKLGGRGAAERVGGIIAALANVGKDLKP